MRNVLIGAFVVGWVASLAAWICVVVFGLKVLRNVHPGVSPWSRRFAYNPANVIFHPELLTPAGLIHRRRLGCALAVFVALVLGTLVLAAVTKNFGAPRG